MACKQLEHDSNRMTDERSNSAILRGSKINNHELKGCHDDGFKRKKPTNLEFWTGDKNPVF